MQNRYVGDLGKYSLLRYIAKTACKMGVNWYLAPNEINNTDGKHIAYLHNGNYYGYDDKLYFTLKNIVDNNL